MKVLEYLNNPDNSLDKLKTEYGIKVSQNEDYPDLFCLNYNQIESPKNHPITNECRSLVLGYDNEKSKFFVVSRAFDRFYNLGEIKDVDHDIYNYYAQEKLDGSLVSVFWYNGEWLYRTKSMIMPSEDMKINSTDCSWVNLIESTLLGVEFLDTDVTYIFEIVSPENRIVTKYDESKAYLLGIRKNPTGAYVRDFCSSYIEDPLSIVGYPQTYFFNTIEDCLKVVKELPNLEEGYVFYNSEDVPVLKVKSPAYVAAHRLRGDLVLTGKRIMDIIFMNEQDEYLAIFPEDQEIFGEYLNALFFLRFDFDFYWRILQQYEDRKYFAEEAIKSGIHKLLFLKLDQPEKTFDEIFNNLSTKTKYNLVEKFLSKS